MPNEQNMRTMGSISFMGGNEIITVFLLAINRGSEAKICETFLQIASHTIHTSLGVSTRVDIHNSLQVLKIRLHDALGSLDHRVLFHVRLLPLSSIGLSRPRYSRRYVTL